MVVYHSTATGLNYKTYEEAMEPKNSISVLFLLLFLLSSKETKLKKLLSRMLK